MKYHAHRLKLIDFIPTICERTQCREAVMVFRVAVEMEDDKSPLMSIDNLLTLLVKIKTLIRKKQEAVTGILPQFYLYPLVTIYQFLGKSRTFFSVLSAFRCSKYM